ncbi:MAG: hypothetical protein PHE55_05800 [Methylococcaceae bacterium]|nr:hypothetical protein [Methylococcaceae bacterium]
MSAIEEIEKIWRSYLITKDCLKIAKRSLDEERYNDLRKGTGFFEASQDAASQEIETSQMSADEYLVLSLWICFERNLFSQLKQDIANPHAKLFNVKIEEHIERLRIFDVLEAFKIIIDSNLIGKAKQICEY